MEVLYFLIWGFIRYFFSILLSLVFLCGVRIATGNFSYFFFGIQRFNGFRLSKVLEVFYFFILGLVRCFLLHLLEFRILVYGVRVGNGNFSLFCFTWVIYCALFAQRKGRKTEKYQHPPLVSFWAKAHMFKWMMSSRPLLTFLSLENGYLFCLPSWHASRTLSRFSEVNHGNLCTTLVVCIDHSLPRLKWPTILCHNSILESTSSPFVYITVFTSIRLRIYMWPSLLAWAISWSLVVMHQPS